MTLMATEKPTKVDHSDWAGWREGRVARSTRTEVNLFHAQESGIESDPVGGRWVTVCEPHGSLVLHLTRALAREALPHPELWCEHCKQAMRPAKIRFKKHHPITGRKSGYRDWWFEYEGVVFRVFAEWLGDVWTIQPDTDHAQGSKALVSFVRSDAYWCDIAMNLKEARASLAEFIASDRFEQLRSAFTTLPVKTEYRQVAWDESSPVQFHRDR